MPQKRSKIYTKPPKKAHGKCTIKKDEPSIEALYNFSYDLIKIHIEKKTTFYQSKKFLFSDYKDLFFISIYVKCVRCRMKGFQKKGRVAYRQTYRQTYS